MKNKIKKIISKIIKDDSGASTIVEATFVFPIIFFVLFFLIFFSNAYYMKANIDSIVNKAAVEGALLVQDPFSEYVNGKKNADNISEVQVSPYRYLFGKMDVIEGQISSDVKKQINSSGGLLMGMKPKISNYKIAEFDNKVLYSTFVVSVDYKISFPWRFIFSNEPTILKLRSRAEEPVNDTPEFIRITDMVIDMLDGNTTYKKICDKFNKVKDFINNFAEK